MDSISHRYYKHGKTLLSIVSLWPCDKSWSKRVIRIFICLLLTSGTVFQLTTCVKTKCTGDVLLKILPYVIVTIVFLLKYVTVYFKIETVTNIIEQMEQHWHSLKDEQEIKILKKYSELSRYFSLGFAIFMYVPLIAFVCSQFLPDFLDVLLPLNESRLHQIPASIEYFVDKEKYPYFVTMHVNLVISIGTTAVVANETIVILTLYHICALFKIVSYRLSLLFGPNFQSQSAATTKQCTTYERMIDVVKAHKNVIQFGDHCLNSFSTSYFILLILGILSITLCLCRIQLALSLMDDVPELLNAASHLIANVTYLFLTNFLGQSVMDHSSKIFFDIYCTQWYTVSLPTQRILMFAMQRSIDGWALSIGGVFVPCFEGFATIMRMTMSYFMALRSVQR